MQQINLQDLSITELKAFAYDCIAQREDAERKLVAINQQIQIFQSKDQTELKSV